MPCRYFEPLQVVTVPFHPNARLPLIHEYEGLCHACSQPVPVPADSRFTGCNHGNREHSCGRFPADSDGSVLRLTVATRDSDALQILAIEEAEHRPVRWQTVRFLLRSEELMPDPGGICRRAQVIAFCRSYLKRSGEQAG